VEIAPEMPKMVGRRCGKGLPSNGPISASMYGRGRLGANRQTGKRADRQAGKTEVAATEPSRTSGKSPCVLASRPTGALARLRTARHAALYMRLQATGQAVLQVGLRTCKQAHGQTCKQANTQEGRHVAMASCIGPILLPQRSINGAKSSTKMNIWAVVPQPQAQPI